MSATCAISMAVARDLARLGERIKALRGETPAAVIARRAGIAPAYLHAIENASPNAKTDRPSRVSIPVLRAIAAAIPGAKASELLDLAGYEDDAVYDRMKEAKEAREAKAQAPTTVEDLSERLDTIETTMAEILRAIRAADRPPRDQGT